MNAIEKFRKEQISAVIRTNDVSVCYDTARALIDGGIKLLEITIENPLMTDIITKIQKEYSQVMVIAGGIITSRQANMAIVAGAKAVVSPIFQMNLVKLTQAQDIPIITTATTANEAYQAWKSRVPLIKIFPSQQMGGASYIHDLLRPMTFLRIIATGNIRIKDFIPYLEAGALGVTIGRDLWEGYSLKEIKERAKFALDKLKEYKEN